MGVPGVKPKEDRSQVRHRARVHEFTEVDNVPFEGGPELTPRSVIADPLLWAEAGVVPMEGWPPATQRWWNAIRRMPHCTLWSEGDWEFAQLTAEVHARVCEGWKGYTGAELRQREKLMGVYLDARRDLRIKYVEPKPEAEDLPAGNVVSMNSYRDL